MVREKLLDNYFFPGQGKLGTFVDGQGNLERTWKVREKSGKLKINAYCGLQKLYLFCSSGKNILSS